MATRHASSHAFATLLTMVAATAFATWLRMEFTRIMDFIDGLSEWILDAVVTLEGAPKLVEIEVAPSPVVEWGCQQKTSTPTRRSHDEQCLTWKDEKQEAEAAG